MYTSFGARYLDVRRGLWTQTDPALGEYVPAAGKGTEKDAGNHPGMGGLFNTVNGNLYHYAGNNPVKYTDPDGRAVNFVIGAIIGFLSSSVTEVGSRMMQGQSFSEAVSNTFSDPTSRGVILASTVIGSVTSGVSGMAVKAATKTVTTATSLSKSGVQIIGEVALKTTAINTVAGAVDSGLKDITTKAIKGESQNCIETGKVMLQGAASSMVFSGVTEGIIAASTTATGEIGNLYTGTINNFKINQPSWAGAVGVVGESIVPTVVDVCSSL